MQNAMKKKWMKLAALGVAATLGVASLAACGSTNTNNTSNDTAGTTDTSAGGESTASDASSGETRELTLSIGNPEGSDNWEKYSVFADKVNELSGGTLTVKIYASGTLAKDQEAVSALMDGTVDFAHVLPSVASSTIPDVSVLDLPGTFSYKSVDDATSLIDFESTVHDTLDSIYADYGLKYLAMNQATQAVIICNSKQITTPEDCQSMAFRSAGKYLGKLIESWGASATTMDMSDLSTALERNQIQGTLTAYGVVGSNSLYEVAPYITYMNATNNVAQLVMCGDTWNSLTEEQQGWITEAAKAYMEGGPAIGAKFYEKYRSDFEAGNAQIYDLSEEEEAAFLEPAAAIKEEMKAECTEKGIALIEEVEAWNAAQ